MALLRWWRQIRGEGWFCCVGGDKYEVKVGFVALVETNTRRRLALLRWWRQIRGEGWLCYVGGDKYEVKVGFVALVETNTR